MKSKILKMIVASLALSAIVLSAFSVSATNEVGASIASPEQPYRSYTYWTDVNTSDKVAVYSKPMYDFELFVRSSEIGGSDQSSINDVVSFNGFTYVLDGGLSKIYMLNGDYSLQKTIENLSYNGEALDFAGARGLCADQNGYIYIADTENARVIVVDRDGNVSELILLPDSPLIPTDFSFKPIKVAIDENGYKYISSDGSYYGAILYSPQMEFLGFYGANEVNGTVKTVLTNIWNRLFSNDTKRAADTVSLPYTITDITVGPDNFIYTATGKTASDGTVQTGQVCVYNPGGKEILGADDVNFADTAVGTFKSVEQIQDISGLDVDSEGYMYLLDATYGRIFLYDKECNLLQVFGGSLGDGNQNGTFQLATAIAVNGSDIIVTDSQKNGFSVFKITEYGSLVKQADSITLKGDFDEAYGLWQEILNEDSNNQLAYRGIAKALYDMGEDKEAMEYSLMGYDRDTYGKAFENVRNEWLESNFTLIAICAVLFAALIAAFVIIKKKKNIVIFKSAKSKTLVSCVMHPVESFREIKEKGTGSLTAAFVLLILFYVVTVLRDTAGGFIFTVFDSESYNSLYVLLSTVGLVVLWTLSNWLVCTLLGGIGKIKEIFIVTCYCLIPIITGYALELILTHILVKDESAFMGIMVYAFILYAAFMLIIGIMRIHDYEFGRFVATTALTVISMLIIIFLVFLIFMLAQQLFGWLTSVLIEVENRL